MATQDLIDRLSALPGTAQSERDDPRLAPESAPLDDRDAAALLAGARALAQKVRHYGSDPTASDGDWAAFFPAGDRAALAALAEDRSGRVAPHLALLIAAFKLGGAHTQRLLNGFTARQLQFQMQQVLGFVPRAPRPDHAHLLVELKKGAPAVEIDTVQRFSAGKDTTGIEQLYAPLRPVVVSAARVEQLWSLRRDGERLRFAPVANSADGLGAPLAADEPRWPPFGSATLPAAPVGFAVASRLLRLAEGTRQVQVVLQLSGLQARHDAAALAASFQAHASGPKGWLGPFDVTATLQGDSLAIGVTLGAAQEAVVDHDPAVHLQSFPTGLPVLQLLLKPDAVLAFGAFDGVAVRSAQLRVQASGLRALTLEGDAGPLDPKQAFLPFGPLPVAGSRLFVGCAEALSKPLQSLALQFRWHGAPDDLPGWYAGYDHQSRLANGVGVTLAWQDAASNARSTPPLDLMQRVDGTSTLRPPVGGGGITVSAAERVHALRASAVFAAQRAGQIEALRQPARRAVAAAPAARTGFVTLTLVEDFLHGDYRRETVQKLLRAPPVVLNEPYTPKVQQITLDYSALSGLNRLDVPQQAAFTDADLQFFHVDAFGASREQAWLTRQRPWAPQGALALLPPHADAGELCIGLGGLGAGDSVSLLLQVAQGSADPLAQPQSIQWSVLADNAWRALTPAEIALDTTRSLRTSGLLTVALPRETSLSHTRLPTGLVWLRAGIATEPRAACDLVGVHANAVEVSFIDQGNDPARLARPLAAGSITKLKTTRPEAKAVTQPYASFGGALQETDSALARRAAERLRHRGRAITLWDTERLVLENFPAVHRAKCIPHASGTSWLAAGHAMVVVVPDLHNRNAVDRLQPRVDLDTLERIHALLAARCGIGVQWQVANPRYRALKLDFKLRLRAGFGFNHSRKTLNAAIVDRLSPWASSGDAALDFGGRIVRSALLDFIEAQHYVDYVTDFRMFADGDPHDLAEATAGAPDAILVSVPEHLIAELADG